MMPEISTMAILFSAPLSSLSVSSNLGPTARLALLRLGANPRLKKLPIFNSMLKNSRINTTIAKTIHPRPRRGAEEGKGDRITGGVGGGGGAGLLQVGEFDGG